MYSRFKSYFAYPMVCTASLVNMTGNTVFRTINALQFIYSFNDFKPNKMHPAVFVPAILTGVGTAIVTSSTKFGAIENKMFKQQTHYDTPTDAMASTDSEVSLSRKMAGELTTYTLYGVSIFAGMIASISYYFGGRTLTTAFVDMVDMVRESSTGSAVSDEPWKEDMITYTAFVLMLAQAYEFFSYDLDKTFRSAKHIGHLIQQGEFIHECQQIDKPARNKVLGLVGFTVLFAPLHAVFTTKPSLQSLPFEIPSTLLEYIVYMAAGAHATKLIVGELPSIYGRVKAGIGNIEIPETSMSALGVTLNPWKVRIYTTYAGMALDSLAAGLTSFRSLSYSAEDFGGDPHNKWLIAPAAINGLSGGSKTLIFSGIVGLSDRVSDWKKKQRHDLQASTASYSPGVLPRLSIVGSRSAVDHSPFSPKSPDSSYIELQDADKKPDKRNPSIQVL